MKAMILAAGRGERMRPLTDEIPKPLLEVHGKTLVEYRLESLRAAGIHECVINLSYKAKQIEDYLGDGNRWDMSIQYSHEGDDPLESAGGIIQALPLLGENPFVLTNADIWTDFNFQNLPAKLTDLAHLIMVNNPEHHPNGDFSLKNGTLRSTGTDRLTYSGIGIYSPLLFKNYAPGKQALKPILLQAMKQNQITGQHYSGTWFDIGTPERLEQLNQTNRV